MGEQKHTPWPWHQCGGGNWRIISDEHHMQVARTSGVVRFAANGKSRQYSDTSEEKANAALIVKAPLIPELVQQLKEAQEEIAEYLLVTKPPVSNRVKGVHGRIMKLLAKVESP